MKLYSNNDEPKIKIAVENKSIIINESKEIDKDIITLETNIKAFNSLVVIEEQVASENFNFIDKGNYVLYNEYINTVTRNLGIKNIPVVSQESLNTLSSTALNHNLALEGFIGEMWKKIKEIFGKIYNAIKEFFKKYFTRLGRLKNKLQNLSEVISETNKDLNSTKRNLNSVPGALAKKYPVNGDLDYNMVTDVLSNTKLLIDSMNDINKKASDFIGKDVLDKNFIANINKLKQDIESSGKQIDENNKDKKEGSVFKEAKFGEDGKHNKGINDTNKSLADDANDKTRQMNKDKDTVGSITNKETNIDSEDVKAEEAKKEFDNFVKTLVDTLDKVKGKSLINGNHIKSVSGTDDGLEIETDDITDTPSSVSLGSKDNLLKMVKDAIDIISIAEKLTGAYGKVNDIVMDKLNDVDKLILDLDKTDDAKLGKYKKVLNNKVKVRLNLVKIFFNNYNKVAKNIFEMALESGDGVVEYSTLSLKHFG